MGHFEKQRACPLSFVKQILLLQICPPHMLKKIRQCITVVHEHQCFFFGEISDAGEEKKNSGESNKGLFGNF
jgi:hypothetical protein